jgi:S-methylmethionine-dependent homocysteine/selenocysteine methylase
MPLFRDALPMLQDRLFVTDGGIETTLIHQDGLALPSFAAFVLLSQRAGLAALIRYYLRYVDLASRYRTGLVLESPTWRASRDWGRQLGYSREDLIDLNRQGIALVAGFRARPELGGLPVVLSGCLGPRGDGYRPGSEMTAEEAAQYHAEQITTFAATEADLITAFTINYSAEAVGIARAARRLGMPVVISFTVETDGRLPTGESLQAAVEGTDAATGGYPAYYMINCAHPTHFAPDLLRREPWTRRLRGLRANASTRSHRELDEAASLDQGSPLDLGAQYRRLCSALPGLVVLGGCCGTDHRHVEAMIAAVGGVAAA